MSLLNLCLECIFLKSVFRCLGTKHALFDDPSKPSLFYRYDNYRISCSGIETLNYGAKDTDMQKDLARNSLVQHIATERL